MTVVHSPAVRLPREVPALSWPEAPCVIVIVVTVAVLAAAGVRLRRHHG